ncbi:MAG: site-specific integrase [Thermosphaera sp.]
MPGRIDVGKAPSELLELSNQEVLQEFVMLLESTGASKDTIKAYQSAINDFLEFIGSKPLKEVSLRDVLAWRNERLRNGFPRRKTLDKNKWQSTLHYYTIFLKRFFEWLGLELKIPSVKKPSPKITALTDEEVNKLLAAARGPLDTLILRLLLDTGLRSKEILSLRVGDIDFDNGVIKVVEGKYGKERYVTASSDTFKLIESWIKLNNLARDDRLVNLTYGGLYKKLKRLALRAGIPPGKVRPHVLRHTFATRALRSGISLPSLQRLLGHTDIRTTQVYLHLTIDDIKREYREKLENKLSTIAGEGLLCPSCRRSIPADAVFCPYCGTSISKSQKNLALA